MMNSNFDETKQKFILLVCDALEKTHFWMKEYKILEN